MKTASLIFEILAILAQMFHNYWIIYYSSGLSNKVGYGKKDVKGEYHKWFSPKQIQAWIFCGIIDVSIVFSLLEGMQWWANTGIAILCMINYLYVFNVYEDWKNNKNIVHKVTVRRKFVAYFMATLIPACIYVFAVIYSSYA